MIHRYNLPPEVTKVNPLIAEDPADTLYRVADALKSLAESLINEATCSGGDAPTIGRASMLDVCAATLEFQAEVIERARGDEDDSPSRPGHLNKADTGLLGAIQTQLELRDIPDAGREAILATLRAAPFKPGTDEASTDTTPESQTDIDDSFLEVMNGMMDYHGIPEDSHRKVLEALRACLKKDTEAA